MILVANWDYCHVSRSAHGTMQCATCRQPITDGRYRYRQKSKGGDWGWQTQHEACCSDDPKWAAIDAGVAASLARQHELSDACKAFKKKWGVTDLDEYIIEESK